MEVKAAQNCFRNCGRDFRRLAAHQGYRRGNEGFAIPTCSQVRTTAIHNSALECIWPRHLRDGESVRLSVRETRGLHISTLEVGADDSGEIKAHLI
jgi:hypothetical protein